MNSTFDWLCNYLSTIVCQRLLFHACGEPFKPGAPASDRRVPGFLELLLYVNVCILVCVFAPEAINN